MLFSENSPGRLEALTHESPGRPVHAVMEIAVAYHQVRGPACHSTDVMKHGLTVQGKPRYRCKNPGCSHQTCLVEYRHYGRLPEVIQQLLEMTLNGSGIRDMARVLHMRPTTVIEALKKSASAPAHQ